MYQFFSQRMNVNGDKEEFFIILTLNKTISITKMFFHNRATFVINDMNVFKIKKRNSIVYKQLKSISFINIVMYHLKKRMVVKILKD